MIVKGDYSEDLGRKEERRRESFSYIRERIYHHEQKVDRNMNVTGVSCEDSEDSEEHFILK